MMKPETYLSEYSATRTCRETPQNCRTTREHPCKERHQ
jgi:hypothetical protein